MHCSKEITIKLFLLSFLAILLFAGCNDDSTPLIPPVDDNAIEIDFPIGKKAIYAIGTYYEKDDSVSGQYLSIYSLYFDTLVTINNIKNYYGKVEVYDKLINDSDSTNIFGGTRLGAGDITVSIDDKWVLFQSSSISESYYIFMKMDSTSTDTTLIPTQYASQFPTFPKTISPNTNYSVYRPASESLFGAVQRDFEVKEDMIWSDIYGTSQGLYCTTEHFIFSFVINFNAIFDSHGIVTSRSTSKDMIVTTPQSPVGADTITYHTINRRIVDFTEPENVNELSWYAEYVKENGLIFLKDD